MPAWDDLEGNKTDPDHSAHTSIRHQQPSKQIKLDRKRKSQQEDDALEKVRLADGRMAYVLLRSPRLDSF